MKGVNESSGCRVRFTYPVVLMFLFAGLVGQGRAESIYVLSDANSAVAINAEGTGGVSAGMTSWLVDSVNQVKQQWFYYRIGDSGPNQSIDSMGNVYVAPRNDLSILDITYSSDATASPAYQARVVYTLTGQSSGSGMSHLGETVTFYNNSASTLNLRFFDYSDFDLAGMLGNQSVTVSKTAAVGPAGRYNESFFQTMGSYSVSNFVSQTGANSASYLEASTFSSTLQVVTNGGPANLSDISSAYGDVTAGMEWVVTLSGGASLQISKNIDLKVPEPSCAAVLGLGLLVGVLGCRNRGRFSHSDRKLGRDA